MQGIEFLQNQAATFNVFMASTANPLEGLSGLTLSVQVAKGAGAYTTVAPTSVFDRGSGSYSVVMPSTAFDTAGAIEFRFTGTGAVASHVYGTVVAERAATVSGVWAHGTRTMTGFGTLAADVATAVWASGTRTLTGFGSLVADIATAVWGAGARTLTAIADSAGVTTLVSRLTAGRATNLDNLDASVSTRSTLTAAGVWAHTTRELTGFGTLVADMWGHATRTLTAIGDSTGVTTLLGRVTGTIAAGTHQPQSGDSFGRLGAGGAGLTGLGDARIANLDAPVGAVPGLVWDRPLAGHNVAGTAGAALATAGTGGIPPEVTAAIMRTDAGVATLQATGLTAPTVSTAVKIRLVRGYDYLASAGTAAELRASGWPVLTGATIDMAEPEAPHARFAVGSVAVAGAGEQVVRFEFDDAFTSALSPGLLAKRLRAVLPGGAVVHLGDIVLEVV